MMKGLDPKTLHPHNDNYKVGHEGEGGREWKGALAKCGPLAEDFVAKLKRGQLNMKNY
jgi:hypothetical protein